MTSKIKIHIFLATMTFLFGWYYLVDTLPRSRLIPHYVTQLTAAADAALASGTLQDLRVEQPMFYLDNPVVSVHPGEAGGYEIRFAEASRRRCEQLTSNDTVKQRAAKVIVAGDACADRNLVTLVIAPPR